MSRLPDRILIANRGEVAVRIARTCREMGITTTGVFSDADAHALHVDACDEAVRLPGNAPADTYLRGDLLIAAAARTAATAVHPGFGFLAEDAAFARAVLDAGLLWIGPSPEAIEGMGDKLAAKQAMAAAGVPLLPSVALEGEPDRGALLELAEQVGLPLIVKPAAGGGGKGMRVVHDLVDLGDAVEAARREAVSSFGDGRLFLERYVARPRHLEVQVLGDTSGNIVHLFERECSIQRRHQKVLEESPSAAIDDEVRSALCDAAVAAAASIGYAGAGTVEFVADERLLARKRSGEPVDPRETFAFLEMNTRLQVEHPVTEEVVRVLPVPSIAGGPAVTAVEAEPANRVDLVRLQILVAAGHAIPFPQEAVVQQGHAIEVRLYAEDPARGYLPSSGLLHTFAPDPAIRWDVGVAAGEIISPYYDPMLAKAIAHAPTREEAAIRLAASLAASPVAGVTSNQDLLLAILRDEAFLAGDTTTAYLDERGEVLLSGPTDDEVDGAAIAAAIHDALRRHANAELLTSLRVGFVPSGTFEPQARFVHGDDEVLVRYRQQRDGNWRVQTSRDLAPDSWTPLDVDDDAYVVRARQVDPKVLSIEADGHLFRVTVLAADHARLVGIGGRWIRFVVPPRFPSSAEDLAPGASVSPMPGRVASLSVSVGDEVVAGDALLTVEAMKMEHRLTAAVPGKVTEVRVAVGDQVEADDVLVVVEPAPDEPAEDLGIDA